MRKINEENERIKRRYFTYMRQAKGRDNKTIAKLAAALIKYEQSTGHKSFKRFHIEDAGRFKTHLDKAKNARTKKPLSHATIDSTLRTVKAFFLWLAGQPGYKSRISYADAEYFNNTLKNARIAHTHRPMEYPSLKQCQRAFEAMPERTVDQKLEKAAFAFFLLTGGRLKAVSTLRLKHINLEDGRVYMDAREVATKGAKSINTWFYPVDPMYRDYFESWMQHLTDIEFFGPEDPLFPKPRIGIVKGKGFQNLGLSRKPYASTSKLYKAVKTAFSSVQMPAYSPHNFRRTHASMMKDHCKNSDDMQAWGMNFGHDDLITTFRSYNPLSVQRQGEIMQAMQKRAGGQF
ncbi:tyrosine-type recombinase/integrase [Litorimonas sp. WD9-15]|uniref:tyrosine-type recombinase/integrase n=1 Tax=Litorimonas sp. WD9-15 TaxID=3418716 RepID=UPI003D017136